MQQYFLYSTSISERLTKIMQNIFYDLYLNSLNQFTGLRSNLPSKTLERILHSKNNICAMVNAKTRRKVRTRFDVPIDKNLI
jgi:hypothetical protein